MTSFLTFLLTQLHSQFVGGGLVLLFTGSILALMRATPGKLIGWIKRRITVEVEILNSDPFFDHVTFWLNSQPYTRRSRKLTATTVNRLERNEDTCNAPAISGSPHPSVRVFLSPAPGMHVFGYRHNLIWLHRNREQAGAPSSEKFVSIMKHETYTITMLGRRQRVIRDLIDEIVKFGARPTDSIKLFNSSFGYWCGTSLIYPRKLETIVLPNGVVEYVLDDIKRFLTSADWYRSVGIPWHRGYLLYGTPGSGKTSLVTALAGELGMDLYALNIGGSGMNDERLYSLMSDVRAGTIILMEDVDCTFPDREPSKDDRPRITLGGLLNCLDGVQSREGCMIFMTTNFRERLDSALTRPGRVDVSLKFSLATDEQILRLRDRLAPDWNDDEILVLGRGKTMAEVQQLLLEGTLQECNHFVAEEVKK